MLVVVGGHSRNIGKTSVMAGLIAAAPELDWTAVKITQFGHGVCSTEGEPCECADVNPEHPYALSEERDASSGTDSSRYLAAGARQSFWLRTTGGQLGNAMPALRRILASSRNVMLESNSVLQFLKPELYLVVLDFANDDFKASSLRYLDRADALIVIEREREEPRWDAVSRRLWESKPRFAVRPPQYVTEAMAALVRGRSNSSSPSAGPAECASARASRTASDT